MKTARSYSIPFSLSGRQKVRKEERGIEGKWKEVLSRSERLSTGKSSDLQGIEYETYTLSRREWVLYGAEGILLASVLDYVFYRSLLLILLILPAGILFPLSLKKKLAEAKEEAYQVPNIDLVDYLGYEQYLEEIYVLGPGDKRFMDATGYHSLRADLKAEKDGQASYARGCCYVSELADDSAKKLPG